ncbi:Ig-like domain-containing protein, partial [Stenotrophomonas sp. C3(2023)]|uniref:Ig-like domain-containing protein n=1 Tax=Stenotrophomonas sp. C3(2023) TaxID=3080277 RepID=UPI00293C7078
GSLSYTPTAGFTGTDTLTYQVCLPAPDSVVCHTAVVTITVAATLLQAANDDFRPAALAPGGGSTSSVLLNDTFNGVGIVPGTTPVTATLLAPPAGYTMAPDGVITVAGSVP